MIIDEKGKLFGKINIIDLIVILVVIAGVLFAGARFMPGKTTPDSTTLIMKFYIEEANNFVADKVVVGGALYDDSAAIDFGTITGVERDASVNWGLTQDGKAIKYSKDGYSSLIITGEVRGEKTKNGAIINDQKYGVGHSMVLRAGDAKLYLRVYDIQVK